MPLDGPGRNTWEFEVKVARAMPWSKWRSLDWCYRTTNDLYNLGDRGSRFEELLCGSLAYLREKIHKTASF